MNTLFSMIALAIAFFSVTYLNIKLGGDKLFIHVLRWTTLIMSAALALGMGVYAFGILFSVLFG